MSLEFEDRPSDSPYVERVWRCRSENVDRMTSIASSHWNLVVWEQSGRVCVAVQGPETKATRAPVPEDATFLGIRFTIGTSMPHLPVSHLVDSYADLPAATSRSFWLRGSAWHHPDFDNAEAFVRRLVRTGALVHDPVVDEVLRGDPPGISPRSIQRRFVTATGLSRGTIRQIERARQATVRLHEGAPVLELIHELGYFDQSHVARSLTRFVGLTATQLSDRSTSEQLSLLYKTASSGGT